MGPGINGTGRQPTEPIGSEATQLVTTHDLSTIDLSTQTIEVGQNTTGISERQFQGIVDTVWKDFDLPSISAGYNNSVDFLRTSHSRLDGAFIAINPPFASKLVKSDIKFLVSHEAAHWYNGDFRDPHFGHLVPLVGLAGACAVASVVQSPLPIFAKIACAAFLLVATIVAEKWTLNKRTIQLRNRELAADKAAVDYTGDLDGAIAFFRKIETLYPELATDRGEAHPSPANRIKYLESNAKSGANSQVSHS